MNQKSTPPFLTPHLEVEAPERYSSDSPDSTLDDVTSNNEVTFIQQQY